MAAVVAELSGQHAGDGSLTGVPVQVRRRRREPAGHVVLGERKQAPSAVLTCTSIVAGR